MHLGIDAVNIREGGGITHLTQILNVGNPSMAGIDHVTVWTRKVTLANLPSRTWLTVRHSNWMEGHTPFPQIRQHLLMSYLAHKEGVDLLFAPGGNLPAWCMTPSVTMSRSMLPFDQTEISRFSKWSWMRLKMSILRQSQIASLKQATGVIFLTQYARETVLHKINQGLKKTTLVPHGIESRFQNKPRKQLDLSQYSRQNPYKLLYVSYIWPYKHQYEVATAVARLWADGLPVQIRFVGSFRDSYGKHFLSHIRRLDPTESFIIWHGAEPFEKLHALYAEADAFVFASSCENMPNILVEAMAAGLPIACAKRGPMPEVLGDAGVYFDPDSVDAIANAIHELIIDVRGRARYAEAAALAAKAYSWDRCASDTFRFIREVYDTHRQSQ